MITLRQIQFALAVARHKHFKRAAEECNISQSALSLGISEMEKSLGVIIFERNNKQVVVTPIGEELLSRAGQIYLDAQQLVERAHAGKGELNYGMAIGFIPTIAPYLLPAVFPLLRKYHPEFKLDVHEEISDRVISMVQNGLLDAAVIALPYDTASLKVLEFADECFFVLMHESNPSAHQERISVSELKTQPLLLLGEGNCLSDHILNLCDFAQDLGKDHFRNASLNTLIHMTANNMGVTLVPEIALPSLPLHQGVRAIPLLNAGPHRRLALVTRQNYPRIQELEHLKSIFENAILELKNAS